MILGGATTGCRYLDGIHVGDGSLASCAAVYRECQDYLLCSLIDAIFSVQVTGCIIRGILERKRYSRSLHLIWSRPIEIRIEYLGYFWTLLLT